MVKWSPNATQTNRWTLKDPNHKHWVVLHHISEHLQHLTDDESSLQESISNFWLHYTLQNIPKHITSPISLCNYSSTQTSRLFFYVIFDEYVRNSHSILLGSLLRWKTWLKIASNTSSYTMHEAVSAPEDFFAPWLQIFHNRIPSAHWLFNSRE